MEAIFTPPGIAWAGPGAPGIIPSKLDLSTPLWVNRAEPGSPERIASVWIWLCSLGRKGGVCIQLWPGRGGQCLP